LDFQGVTTLTTEVAPKTNFSVSAARELNAWYLPASNWVDTAFASLSRPINKKTFFETDAGWVHIVGYSGYYVSPQVRRSVRRNLDFIATYRYFGSTSGFSSKSVLGLLLWHPVPQTLQGVLDRLGLGRL
jgi:hypothetical protein